MNKCVQMEEIPDSWRKASLKLLFKGKHQLAKSLQRIVLESTIFKVLTRAIMQRLDKVIDLFFAEEQLVSEAIKLQQQ